MDSRFNDISFAVNGLSSESHDSLSNSNHYPDFTTSFDSMNASFLSSKTDDFNYASSLSIDDLDGDLALPPEQDGGSLDPNFSLNSSSPSLSDDSNSSDPVLKYISQMLMEENMEEKTWLFHDDLALEDTEKSFYDVLGEKAPNFPHQEQEFDVSQFLESPSSNFSGSSSDQSSFGTTITTTNSSSSVDPHWLSDPGEHNHASPPAVDPPDEVVQLNSNSSSQLHINSMSSYTSHVDGLEDSSVLVKNMFSDAESILQFNRGLEEAKKFLLASSQLTINFGSNNSNSEAKRGNVEVDVYNQKNEGEYGLGARRVRKYHEREELDSEESRLNKQSASNVGETEFAEWFDRVLLWDGKGASMCSGGTCGQTEASRNLQPTPQLHGANGGRGRGRRRENKSSVDLRSLLVLCAQAVSTYDLRTAGELLKQIRQNSSPDGDGSQRLAHYFANGLEARLAGNQSGTGTQSFFTSVINKRTSVAEILKGYHLHLSSCPFKKFPIIYANFYIYKLAEKATVLHIIDFGIAFGFQWPILIQKLGERSNEGLAPLVKLRITGIELPQPGFRPAERLDETARCLARYCERFNVPFEFNPIPSRNWETIRIEDLKIESNEMIAVNCLGRFKNLFDETVEEDSPRDVMLSLIRKVKPDVFVHTIPNGSYNAPFFVTRFREALFHLSSIYDMFDATIPSNNETRVVLEREFYGREIMNVVACEGPARVERPETYKQWQARHVRAGLKQVPLCQVLMNKLRTKLKTYYHKDFVIDEDNNWMLLGWKGRITYATACWVPA